MSEVVECCEHCRGAGIEGVRADDKRDRPPIEVCGKCDGSGKPKEKTS